MFTMLNISGLVLSLAIVLLISVYVRYELSFDKHFSGIEQVYRVYGHSSQGENAKDELLLPSGLTFAMQKELPGINQTALQTSGKLDLGFSNKRFELNETQVSGGFFELFPFHFIAGSTQATISSPNSIVLTEYAAQLLFSQADPLGKILNDGRGHNFQVTGIIANIPSNTHFKADVITRIGESMEHEPLDWRGYSGIVQYIKLKEHVDPSNFVNKLNPFLKKYNFPPGYSIKLEPAADIHLYSHKSGELEANSDIRYIYIFGASGIPILLIACFNYVNLSTARSLHRSTEVGVRKVFGASRKQLIVQFLGESLLFFFISMLLAIVLAYATLPIFSSFLNADKGIISFFNITAIGFMIAASLLFGILAGYYPAFYLSGQLPQFIIKGILKSGSLNNLMRKSLVTFQFTISLFFIIATLVIYGQLSFIRNKNLGFDKEQLIILPSYNFKNHASAFESELLKNPHIKYAAISSWNPGIFFGSGTTLDSSKTKSAKPVLVQSIHSEFTFVPAIGLTILSGRNFSPAFPGDTMDTNLLFEKKLSSEQLHRMLSEKSMLVNESFVRELGIDHPVGKMINIASVRGTIIGVVKDFNGMSLHEPVQPVIIYANPTNQYGSLFIRILPGNINASIFYIQKTWQKYFPESLFRYAFVDETLNKLYISEQKMAAIFTTYSILGIVISCLGIFGLVAYTSEKRKKEIGIRKVLGATISNIVILLSTEYLRLFLIACLVSFPIAAWLMSKWLMDFAYRIKLDLWIFVAAGLGTMLLCYLTIGYEAIKAAIANPANSLRSE